VGAGWVSPPPHAATVNAKSQGASLDAVTRDR
jgi:hypothetical protein